MFRLLILNGREAGRDVLIKTLPCQIGRNTGNQVCLQGLGVWEHHLQLTLRPDRLVQATVLGEAMALVNGLAVAEATLRKGDVLQLGELKLSFSLAPARQKGLFFRELTTTGMALSALAFEIFLVYWLQS